MRDWEYGTPGSAAGQIAVVRAIYDAFARRDLEAALLLMAPDIEMALQATSRLAERDGPYVGHDGVRQYFEDATRIWRELTLHADDIRATAGSVIVFGHVTGVVGADALRRQVLWTWKLRDGLATSIRVSDLGPA
jgi:ketosteroid isomerase-like protein